MDHSFKSLLSTFFNVTANDFSLPLNRRDVANKLRLKIVKELKKRKGAEIVKQNQIMRRMYPLGRVNVHNLS